MKNKNYYVVLDFETGCVDPRITEPIQIAAVAIDPRTLQIDEVNAFESLMKPKNMAAVTDGALKVNKKTREQLEAAPERGLVWSQFNNWIKQYCVDSSKFGRPIMVGYNNLGFDWVIYDRLCREFGNVDKDGHPNIFGNYMKQDLMFMMHTWFEDTNDIANYKLDTLREFFGMSKEGAHDAKTDVIQTGQIFARFLSFQRKLYKEHASKLKGAFAK